MNNTNYAQNNGFQLVIPRFEGVSFYSTYFQFPSMSLPAVKTGSPFKRIVSAGDTMEYSPLVFRFMINEDLQNYLKVSEWIQSISYSTSFDDFKNYTEKNETQKLGEQDVSVIVLNSSNNPIKTFRFINAIPVALGGFDFTTIDPSTNYLVGEVVFEYDYFEVE